MTPKAKLALATLALGAAVAATGVPAAGDESASSAGRPASHSVSFNYNKLDFADLRGGPVEGIVVAGQRSGRRRVQVFASLHGLPVKDGASSTYLVAAIDRPCADELDGNVDGADFLVWRRLVSTGEPDLLDKSTPKLLGSFVAARSVRVFERSDSGEPRQLTCGPVRRARQR